MPGCRHVLSVPCYRQAQYLADATLCSHKVEVRLPGCGHVLPSVACGQRGAVSRQQCSHACGALLPCEHACHSTCGRCFTLTSAAETAAAAAAGNEALMVEVGGARHPPCQQPCGRPLVCGHDCPSKCHAGSPHPGRRRVATLAHVMGLDGACTK